jgi:hypothetical protein
LAIVVCLDFCRVMGIGICLVVLLGIVLESSVYIVVVVVAAAIVLATDRGCMSGLFGCNIPLFVFCLYLCLYNSFYYYRGRIDLS